MRLYWYKSLVWLSENLHMASDRGGGRHQCFKCRLFCRRTCRDWRNSWADRSLVKWTFKCQVLNVGSNAAHQCICLGTDWRQSKLAEKDLWQRRPTAYWVVLTWMQWEGWGSGSSLSPALVRPYLECCTLFWEIHLRAKLSPVECHKGG